MQPNTSFQQTDSAIQTPYRLSVFRIPLQRVGLFMLFLTLLTHPYQSAVYAANGLKSWYTSIVPILLPSMILAGLLIRTRACDLLHPLFAPVFQKLFHLPAAGADAFLVGILCGYPSGAMVTAELYRQRRLTASDAEHLLQFCNYPSPMFLNGIVLHTALKGEPHILMILLPVYLGGILTGIISRFLFTGNTVSNSSHICLPLSANAAPNKKKTDHTITDDAGSLPSVSTDCIDTIPFSRQLENSLMAAARTILIVGLYMMLFQILAGLAIDCLHLPPLLLSVLTGLLEMTNGTLQTAALSIPSAAKLCMIVGFSVFGGLSTYLQVITVLGEDAHLAGNYLYGRLLHGGLAVGIAILLQMLERR